MNDENKPINKSRSKLNFEECKVELTELGYVTAVHLPTKTFFLQLCKNSHGELSDFNKALNDYGNEQFKLIQEMSKDEKKNALKVHKGDTVLAKYPDDSEASNWYRALILKRDEEVGERRILYLDYGDVVVTKSKLMFVPDPVKLPVITRSPFGITCFQEGSEAYNDYETAQFLEALMNNYLMVKRIANQSKLQYLVSIPKNAYNLPFWVKFGPILKQSSSKSNESSGHHPLESCHVGGLDPCKLEVGGNC